MHDETHAWQDVIKRSDKARLYQYRITDECYHGLQAHLIAHHKQLKDIQKARQYGLDKAFVLYAAEWWRREYDGDWGWQYRQCTVTERNTCLIITADYQP